MTIKLLAEVNSASFLISIPFGNILSVFIITPILKRPFGLNIANTCCATPFGCDDLHNGTSLCQQEIEAVFIAMILLKCDFIHIAL